MIERLQRGDKVMVCRLDCLVVSAVDLVTTIARIHSRNAVLLTADLDGPSSFCNETIDAISSAFATFANRMPERNDSAPLPVGCSAILSSSDWPRIQKDCADPSATAVAKRHSVSRSALYNFSDRMRQETGIVANVEKDAP